MMQDEALHTAESDDPPLARALRDDLVGRVIALAVRDRAVLDAMRVVPRHLFVPGCPLENAYGDHPVSIGFDATISQPSLVGIMSEALALSGHERVLEIGTGSGYQAAVLGRLARHVDTVEVVAELASRAARVLSSIGCTNVDVHTGDGWAGWPERAPYDRIVVTAAPEIVPTALLGQLVDDGLLVLPIGAQTKDQRLERWRKTGAMFLKEDFGAVRFVPMVHA
jgi:protein-L-isoaspartate(D-aspartate) O-methyltransferase